jgi:hypothetical protein
MDRRALVTVLVLGCQRTNASAMTSPSATASSPPVSSVAVLTPLFSAAPAPTPVVSSVPVMKAAKTIHASSKREPINACCAALRKQNDIPPLAVAACDGVVSTLDESDAAPQLEELLRPMLTGLAVPNACKGL